MQNVEKYKQMAALFFAEGESEMPMLNRIGRETMINAFKDVAVNILYGIHACLRQRDLETDGEICIRGF